MRLRTDENVPPSVVRALRAAGHDVASTSEDARSADDRTVLDRARREQRILLTSDHGFGDLVYLTRVAAPPGVILMRFEGSPSSMMASRLVPILASREDWIGYFATIDLTDVRMRPLP